MSQTDTDDAINEQRTDLVNSADTKGAPLTATLLHSRIGNSLFIKGDLGAKEDILIDGRVEGTIAVKNNHVEIGSSGKIDANIFAKAVTICGEVNGDVFASEQIKITKSGRVFGNIHAIDICIEEGAQLKGKIDMEKQDIFAHLSLTESHEEQQHGKSSTFNFLFKKQREVPHVDTSIIDELDFLPIKSGSSSVITSDEILTAKASHERSFIGETVMVRGELISDEDIIIQGGVDGIIYLKNNSLGLGPNSLVKANIFVKSVIAQGEVTGDVYAEEKVILKKPCHLTGNVHSPSVSIESGAVLMGGVEMESQNIEDSFTNISGSMYAHEKPSFMETTTMHQSLNDAEVSPKTSPNNKDSVWPIFYPRS